MDASVQDQVRERYAALLETIEKPDATNEDRARRTAASACCCTPASTTRRPKPAYLNAQALMPQDVRWPYFLAHLYKSNGKTAGAIAAFRRALELQSQRRDRR